MIITMHQPEHLVWLGLIDKISKADIFIIVDTVQYRRHYFYNRNKIRTCKGWQWVIVPLKKHSMKTRIDKIEISYEEDWENRYLNLLRTNYIKAKYFNCYFPEIEEQIKKRYQYLADLNENLLTIFMKWFDVKTKILKSSDLGLSEFKDGNEVVLKHCRRLDVSNYLSGQFGRNYLDLKSLAHNGVKVGFHNFKHPIYKQLYDPFLPGLSAIDLLFNYGPNSKLILINQNYD